MIKSGHRRLARSFCLSYRYTDDLIVFNNKKILDYHKEIYPSHLTVEKANKSDHLADYLDLTFIIDSGGKLSTRLYDKCDNSAQALHGLAPKCELINIHELIKKSTINYVTLLPSRKWYKFEYERMNLQKLQMLCQYSNAHA